MNHRIEELAVKIEHRRTIQKYSAFDLRLPHRQHTERDVITHDLAQRERAAVQDTIQQDHYYRPSGVYIPPDPDLDIGV